MSLPRMSWHIGDYKKDTGHLRAAGHGAYFLLCMHYWATGGLPDDDEQLAAIAGMTKAEWARHRAVMKAFFKGDGPWRHKRIDAELATAQEKYERRAGAGSKGGKAASERRQSSSNATSNASGNALANVKQPITDNPTEEASASSERARKRATRLAEDWMPSEADGKYALDKGLTQAEAQHEFEKFRNYWTAKGGKDAAKTDWPATWRNWILGALERKGKPNGNGSNRGRQSLSDVARELADEARQLEFAAGVVRPDAPFGSA
jgi:uncharacterized protein YdaU (DUF1376 family)